MSSTSILISSIVWRPCWRLIPSRFPPIGLFDRVADPEDLDVVFAIEGLTNDRLRDELGDITLVPPNERVSGPGTTPIMAAFTHLNPEGSRFTDGRYGVYYAAIDIDTAIAETRFHRVRFLAATHEAPIEIDMRSYASDLEVSLHDIRNRQTDMPDIYAPDPEEYAAAQALAKNLRDTGSNGIVYDSVRNAGGECVAIFRPQLLSPVKQGAHYCYVCAPTEGSGPINRV
jgi:RES domain-containing protein